MHQKLPSAFHLCTICTFVWAHGIKMRGMLPVKAWTCERKYIAALVWKRESSNQAATLVRLQAEQKKKRRTSYRTVKPSSIYLSLSLSENSCEEFIWSIALTHALVVSVWRCV